jgi:hypothetical protein
MSHSVRDLWPDDIGLTSVTTPAAILREQAALLAEKTKGLVEGEVKSSASGTSFSHCLELRVPALEDYRYQLLTVGHPIEQYPVTIGFGGGMRPPINAEDEPAFVRALREVLSSDETKRVIRGLVAQVQQ